MTQNTLNSLNANALSQDPSIILNRFNHDLQLSQKRIDKAISCFLDEFNHDGEIATELFEAMRYGILLGGKRLRPYLIYLVSDLLSLNKRTADTMAVSLEAIHAYSLIHDDLPAMDDDALRRGHPTCHIQFGEATAILAADALQTFAFDILSTALVDIPAVLQLKVINQLAKSSGARGMCGGQMLDLLSENQKISLVELKQIHRLKTGELIYAAVLMPAIAAGQQNTSLYQYLESYAYAIGLAFQIQDDILDVIGDTEILGKQAGADALLGKNTYPSLIGLNEAQNMAQSLVKDAKVALAGIAEIDIYQSNQALNQLADLADFIIMRQS